MQEVKLQRRASLLLLLEGDGIARGREMMALSEGEGVVAEHGPDRNWKARASAPLAQFLNGSGCELGPFYCFSVRSYA